MPLFSYEAIDARGAEKRGEIEAGNEQEAAARIRAGGLRPTRIAMKGGRAAAGPAKKKGGMNITFGGISGKLITQFTRQFATLIDAWLPIVRSLDILAGQAKPGPFKNALEGVKEDVEGGRSLSEAMGKYPKAFDRLYTNMVKAGEAGGVLDTILTRLADFREKVEKLRRQIIGAMIYPVIVIFVACIILGFIMVFIIPKFEVIFKDMNVKLPGMTQFLINTSHFIGSVTGGVVIIGGLVSLVVTYKVIGLSPKGRYALDTLKLHLPVFGTLVSKNAISRFCRTLGTLIASGVPILEALNIIRGATGNAVLAQAIGDVHNSIREGDTIAEPLRHSGVFEPIVVNMISVGEETGELDKMLMKVSDNYDNEVDSLVAGLMSILEPVLIVGMAVVVGFIVIAIFLPLVSMMNQLSSGA